MKIQVFLRISNCPSVLIALLLADQAKHPPEHSYLSDMHISKVNADYRR
jgi:hypothetical protein